ncbi:peptidase M1 [Rhodothermaceae bacterium RA]|nr:peptidase M1 [Rhodothermaceae bacterium RA]
MVRGTERFVVRPGREPRVRSLLIVLFLLGAGCGGGRAQPRTSLDSGGPLQPEQAAYDVTFYDLALRVDPADRAIDGVLSVQADVLAPLPWLVLDLDTLLAVSAVEVDGQPRPFERRAGQVWIDLGRAYAPGEAVRAAVHYGGRPRVAERPPWAGGFTWARTADGAPWIATSVQLQGADLWWPCKDHPSDEPDSMALHITVPEPLVVASNGRLRGVVPEHDGWRTYHWFVSTPINTYGVALNIAPYDTIEGTYTSITGEPVPVTFWVLPERLEDGRRLFPQVLDHLAFYERHLGPYPFRADKYGVAHTPFLGMEHQTIIAYGSNFRDEPYGYDWLHHHELGHEWWGNLVTVRDWKDFWIHEGFCTYMQALYTEERFGAERYREAMRGYRAAIRNRQALAPRTPHTTTQMVADADGRTDNDIYYKGAWVLHTLRFLIGDEAFRIMLRRLAYPDPALEASTDGRACRFVSTDDVVAVAEARAGRALGWFFEVYLRQPELPRLHAEVDGDALTLRWEVPGNRPFPMPVEVQIGTERRRVELPDGRAHVPIPEGAEVVVDPDGWLLRADR